MTPLARPPPSILPAMNDAEIARQSGPRAGGHAGRLGRAAWPAWNARPRQMLRAARRLRKAAQEGAVAGFPTAIADLQDNAAKLQAARRPGRHRPGHRPRRRHSPAARFLDELAHAAAAANVTLVQRDGRISVYPLALRLEARAPGRAHRPQAGAAHPAQLPGPPFARVAAAAEPLQRPPVPRPPVPRLHGAGRRPRPGLAAQPARRRPARPARRPARPADPAARRRRRLPAGGVPARPAAPGPPAGRPHRPRPSLRTGRLDRHQGRQAPARRSTRPAPSTTTTPSGSSRSSARWT